MKKAVFLQEWVACTPSLETLDSALYASLWRGLLLETVVDGGPVVLFHPSEDQPEGLVQRFQALFARKKAFSTQELAPYFEDCVGGLGQPKTLEELFLQHTRCVEGLYYMKS